nr:Retrotransposable element Tf2 [Ipomoea batatas]
MLDLPLSALRGIDRPRTIKFSGRVANVDVVIMVDSGASHNFISSHLTGMFKHPLEFTPKFGVRLGYGHRAKSEVTTAPVLVPPNFSQPFIIECDASGTGVGAVLIQESSPITYFCKALAGRSVAKFAYGKEVVVDCFTKYAHFVIFVGLQHPFTAKSLAAIFTKEVVRLNGVPSSIVSDHDPIFLSNFWKEFFAKWDTKLRMSSSYHPHMDGQTEVLNKCMVVKARLGVWAVEPNRLVGSPRLKLARQAWASTRRRPVVQATPSRPGDAQSRPTQSH